MTKQTINLGTGELTGDGESIRSAFDKINDNFDELYAKDATDFDPSSVGESIIPDTDVAYDLGSASNRFRDLYLSGSTIDLGGTTLSIVDGNLQVGGVDVAAGDIDYSEIQNTPTIPAALSDLTNDLDYAGIVGTQIQTNGLPVLPTQTLDIQGSVFADDSTVLVDAVNGNIPYSVLSGAPSFGNWAFNSSVLSDGSTGNAVIQSSPFAGSKLILRARGPSDQDWIFDQDGHLEMPGTFTVGGTGFVNLNNDAQGDTFYGGATTDKAILLLKGADYLAGSDNGGGITIQGGSARNSGDNGDVIISSGNGGLSGTGSVSLIADNAVSLIATQISVAGEFTNTLNADIAGSVFADDSTVLVDGVNGKIVAPVDTTTITNSNGNLTITADNYVLIDSDNGGQINIGQTSGIGDVVLGNTARGTDVQLFGRLFVKGGGVPTTSIGASGDFVGIVAVDSDYLYYCTADYDGVTNIWKRVAWSGDTW